MRKDFGFGKALGGLVYTSCEITGLNLDRLINTLKKQGVDLYDVKKPTNKRLMLTVKRKDCKKLFAITKDLCYNIKVIKNKGLYYPLLYLLKNAGVLIGSLIFIVTAYISNDFIFKIDYTGSGSVYRREVENYLSANGIGVYTRFSNLDLSALGDALTAVSERLSFAECKKVGNVLSIELALSKQAEKPLTGTATSLVATESGVLEKLKAYRGTPLFKVGDEVNAGDVLVDGYYTVGEEKLPQNVIATAVIRTVKYYEYISSNDGEEDIAIMLAEQTLLDESVDAQSQVEKLQTQDGFIYKVTLTVRVTLFVG